MWLYFHHNGLSFFNVDIYHVIIPAKALLFIHNRSNWKENKEGWTILRLIALKNVKSEFGITRIPYKDAYYKSSIAPISLPLVPLSRSC